MRTIPERVEEMVEEYKTQRGVRHLKYDYPEGYESDIKWLRTALTQAHQAGIDEAVEQLKQFIEDIPEAYGWGKEDEEADRGYQICSKNVKAMGRKAIKALQDKK